MKKQSYLFNIAVKHKYFALISTIMYHKSTKNAVILKFTCSKKIKRSSVSF